MVAVNEISTTREDIGHNACCRIVLSFLHPLQDDEENLEQVYCLSACMWLQQSNN